MAPNDLNAPLGQDKRKRPSKLPASAPQLLAGALGLSGLIVVAWAAFVNDPLGGEPIAVVATKLPPATPTDRDIDASGKQHARYDGPAAAAPAADPAAAAPPPGSKTVTIIDGSSGARQQVTIPGNNGNTAPNALLDPKLLETTRHGAIPKIGPDGTRPSARYARPRQIPANKKDSPIIAIVVGGLGISASGTADAFTKLPAPVTFALAPYGVDLEKMAERARAEEHEVLLQIPMEPFDYPDNDPGPQTLLTSLTPEQNVDRLQWLMSRFQGYVGIVSYMGARFTASEQGLSPVLREAAKRGLIYVDDGSNSRSISSQLAGGQNLPFAKADIVIDTVPTPVEIDRALARLEMRARESGTAVGYATAQPGTISRIAEWAKKAEAQGFMLVPITMVAIKAKSS
ncbi:MAG TPA: divergent polysaccharide deacetylase family protein [Pseudolabrys sp.]|nr:divergent polysaccharide deacetylase family protein [Pseudolabrys sp.]